MPTFCQPLPHYILSDHFGRLRLLDLPTNVLAHRSRDGPLDCRTPPKSRSQLVLSCDHLSGLRNVGAVRFASAWHTLDWEESGSAAARLAYATSSSSSLMMTPCTGCKDQNTCNAPIICPQGLICAWWRVHREHVDVTNCAAARANSRESTRAACAAGSTLKRRSGTSARWARIADGCGGAPSCSSSWSSHLNELNKAEY